MECEALRCAVDVHALKVAVVLHDALARRVVGVAAGLAVVRQGHESVLLVPRHAPLRVQAVVLNERGVAVGVVGVTFVPNLRGRGGMVGVAVLVGQRVAARNRTRVGALHLGERFAQQPEAHVHGVAYALGLTTGLHQSVKLVVGVGIAERTAQRFLLLFLAGIGAVHTIRTAKPSDPFRFLRRLWRNNVGNAQNIVYGVVFILRLHDTVSVGREQHALQPFALAVVGVRAFRAVAHARVYGVAVLVVAHLRHDSLFLALLGRTDARYLTRGVVAVGNHFPVGIGDGAHAVVAVVCCSVDVGAHVGLTHHHRAHRLHHLALVAVVVGLASRGVLHQHEPARAVVLGAGLAVGVGDAVEEVLGIEHLA